MNKVVLELPARSTSPRAARQAVSKLLSDVGISDGAHDDALLVVSELVTNAVNHAGSSVEFEAVFDGRNLRLRVSDDDPATPRATPPTPGQVGGWGMYLVGEMCSEWGCELRTTSDGKTVWATLPITLPPDRHD